MTDIDPLTYPTAAAFPAPLPTVATGGRVPPVSTELERLAAAVIEAAVAYVTADPDDHDTGIPWPELEAATLAYLAAGGGRDE